MWYMMAENAVSGRQTGLDRGLGKVRANSVRIMVISSIFSILYALVHGLLPTSGTSVLPSSFFVQQGLLPIVFILYGVLWFSLLAVVFVLIEGGLPGRREMKGMGFGLFFFSLVVVSYLEPLPHSGDIGNELSWMMADGLPLILLGILFGRYLGHDGREIGMAVSAKRSLGPLDALAILIIPIFFMKGRLLSYTVFGIYSSFDANPAGSLIWALTFGLVLGILYFFFRASMIGSTHRRKALFFGTVMFGIDIFLFNFAFALIVDMQLGPVGGLTMVDMFVRVLADVLFVVIAISLYEKVSSWLEERNAALGKSVA
jgi:hypothetical protein